MGVVEQAGGEVAGLEAPLVDKQSARLLWLTFCQPERRIRPIEVHILSLGALIASITLLTTGVLSLIIDRYVSQAVQ